MFSNLIINFKAILKERKFGKKARSKRMEIAYLEKRTAFWKPLLLLTPAILIVVLFTIYPFIIALFDAFTVVQDGDLTGGKFGFETFREVATHPYFIHSMRNSILYTVMQVPISIMISLMISTAITALANKFAKSFSQTTFFLPYVTSGAAISLTFAFLFDRNFGLINHMFNIDKNWLYDSDSSSGQWGAFFVMLMQGIWGGLAFQVLIFTTAMMSVDRDRYKSASIDGSGPVRQFFKITLPSINTTLNFIITMGVIGAFKVFPLGLYQSDPKAAMTYGGRTIVMFIYNAAKTDAFKAGAASVILVLLSIALSIVIKSSIKFVSWATLKGAEWNVQNKIKNSTIFR